MALRVSAKVVVVKVRGKIVCVLLSMTTTTMTRVVMVVIMTMTAAAHREVVAVVKVVEKWNTSPQQQHPKSPS